ncbi:MAG: DUF488 domain-containing protein [Candidatus Obscuribacterales bacterium]|nr:DUF488 domain-containing protein [Candidatus Obscuribacterales bacterium]
MSKVVYTIGHSTHSLDDFLALLEQHKIEVLVDVRSSPYARYAVHFSGDPLQIALRNTSYKYLFLGKELGGKPKDANFYDQEGRLRYDLISQSHSFKSGIARLLKGQETYRIALMCGEEDPSNCHRRHLISPALAQHGIKVLHIRKDGQLNTNDDLVSADEKIRRQNTQLSLFDN